MTAPVEYLSPKAVAKMKEKKPAPKAREDWRLGIVDPAGVLRVTFLRLDKEAARMVRARVGEWLPVVRMFLELREAMRWQSKRK